MNKFNWIIAASTAVILLSACGNDYSNVASYTVEKQECMQPFKCSFVIRLENKLSEQDLTLMSNKIRDDAPTVDNLFINYYLPCMEVGNGAWAAARFTPEFSLNIQDYMLENNPACKDKNDTNI